MNFPVDDMTLDLLEGVIGIPDGSAGPGELTLVAFLEFLSGRSPDFLEVAPDGMEDYYGKIFSEQDVMLALIAEIRRLRGEPDS